MKKKICLFMIGILILSSLMVACGKENQANVKNDKNENSKVESYTLEGVKNKGKLVMGTCADYPPFEFHKMIDGKDQIVGFDIEIGKYIADELGVELEIKDMDFDKLLGGLSTGMLDIVIAGMNPSPEREKEANFSDIYYESTHSVLIRKEDESKYTSIDDVSGKSIGVQIGTLQEEMAKTLVGDGEIVSLNTNPDIVMNLKTNKIDCAIMETPVAESFAKANDDLMLAEGLTIENKSGGVAIAIKKGNDELTEKINEILTKAKSEGLLDKWMVEATELSDSE
ncbi:MAG: transporter substrate-binding domain-containing protein [Tissierellia bacterium]|nr:transporter substrate-binding domain-containing protein [Tissierellia bacterium]